MRYFVFYYKFFKKDGSQGCGLYICGSKTFPAFKEIQYQIIDEDKEIKLIVLTGFNEFKNEQDYLDFAS